MERNGQVPRREKVLALAKALQTDSRALLLAAGYMPEDTGEWRSAGTSRLFEALVPEFSICLRKITELSKDQQLEAAQFLSSYLNFLTDKRAED